MFGILQVIVALIVFKYCYKRWLAVVEQLQQQQQLGRGGEAAWVEEYVCAFLSGTRQWK